MADVSDAGGCLENKSSEVWSGTANVARESNMLPREEKKPEDEPESLPKTVTESTKRFTKLTSLHGLAHVSDKDRHTVGKILWLVFVLSMAAWLLYNLSEFYSIYNSNPYSTSISVDYHEQLPIPAVSVCIKHPLDRSRLQKLGMGDVLEQVFINFTAVNWTDPEVNRFLGNITMQQVMRVGSFTKEEVMRIDLSGTGLPADSMDLTVGDLFFEDAPHRCYTYNGYTNTTSKDKMFNYFDELTMFLHLPQNNLLPLSDTGSVSVMIHRPRKVLSGFPGTEVAFGTAVTLSLKRKETQYLPAPYNSYGGRDCIDTTIPGYRSPLRFFDSYSSENCIQEHLTLNTSSTCNCVTIGDTDLGPNFPHCSLLQVFNCFRTAQSNALPDIWYSDQCLLECLHSTTSVKASVVPTLSQRYFDFYNTRWKAQSNFSTKDILKLKVRYETSLVVKTVHKPHLTVNKIYSKVGGQMGLFLGASMLTIIELLEYFLCILWAMLKHLYNRKQNETKISSLK